MSTLLHAVSKTVIDNVYIDIVVLNIHGQKMPFSASSQTSLSEKSTYSQFEVISLIVELFSWTGVAIFR